jgi:glycerophosphoryl diester phosphodiesterase
VAAAAIAAAAAAASSSEEVHHPVFPENSLAAFRWASSGDCGGADAIELDVWLSADGVAVVNHDADVFRHFDGQGLVSSLTFKQLKALKYLARPNLVGDGLPASHPDIHASFLESERMPSLEEVLDMLEREAPHMKLMIEVKERSQVTRMCQVLATLYRSRPWMYDRTFVAAFNPYVLWRLRTCDARIVTSFLFIDRFTWNLQRNARDNRIAIPWFIRFNYPLLWFIDDLIWWFGTSRGARGLKFLGASLSACEVKVLCEAAIRADRANGIVTSTWCANHEHQKEWLLRQGVTVITDTQFGGGTAAASPRPQIF